MHLFELTRALVDIESITNHEEAVGSFVFEILSGLASAAPAATSNAAPSNPIVSTSSHTGALPIVTLSTHMDTVPPFFLSKEDDEFIWGRGSADAKGIIASMIGAAEKLLAGGTQNFGLLFVVGEERNSAGAFAAARDPRGSRFLINGEPTENKLASPPKASCVTKSKPPAASRIPRIPNSANRRLTSFSTSSRTFAKFRCRKTSSSAAAL